MVKEDDLSKKDQKELKEALWYYYSNPHASMGGHTDAKNTIFSLAKKYTTSLENMYDMFDMNPTGSKKPRGDIK